MKEKEITIKIHSLNGDEKRVTNISNAVSLLCEQVSKFGKWIYVGRNRLRLDPSSAESVANLESVLEETDSSVHVTGALRGGSEKLEDMKYLTIRNLCKEYKIPHYYEMNKAQMIESIKKAQLKKSKATAPKGSKINELYISDEAPETLIEGKKILVVVVLDGDKLIIGNSKEFFSMKNEVASLILNAME